MQLDYAIGVAEAVSFSVETFGTEMNSGSNPAADLAAESDLHLEGIIEKLGLRRPIYHPTAAYGHFGRCYDGFPWEAS